jgi:hypothetical protein
MWPSESVRGLSRVMINPRAHPKSTADSDPASSDRAIREYRPADEQAVLASGYQDPALPSDETIGEFAAPLLGTRESARQFQRWIASLHALDLLSIEHALNTLQVPSSYGARATSSSSASGPTGFARRFRGNRGGGCRRRPTVLP